MTYQQVLEAARTCSGPYCKACPVCNGRACKNAVPGPGAKGSGTVAIRNYEAWQDVCLNMDTICSNGGVDTSFTLFGQTYDLPVFAGPVGAVKLHYGEKYNDQEYNDILVPACAKAGIAAFTGDGTDPSVFSAAAKAIGANEGKGIPTVKPWDRDTLFAKLDAGKASGARMFAMDIDAAGLPFLKGLNPPAGSKTVSELREVIEYAKVPFIIKGIMTVKGAKKALEAGCKEVLWLDAFEHKYVEEVGTSNAFFMIDNEIITAPLMGSILPGVTRDSTITLLKKWGYNVSERRLAIDDIEAASKNGTLQEAWATGTACVISPIGYLRYKGEDIVINSGNVGPVSQKLYDTIYGMQTGTVKDDMGWVMTID